MSLRFWIYSGFALLTAGIVLAVVLFVMAKQPQTVSGLEHLPSPQTKHEQT